MADQASTLTGHGLGRRTSSNFDHVGRRSFRAFMPPSGAPFTVERRLDLPTQYRLWYDQGKEGACVGYAFSWMMSVLNRRKYVAMKLYAEAQARDEWDDTPPESGTSLIAAATVLLTMGHWRFFRGFERIVGFQEGIAEMRWATTVDEIRMALNLGTPVVIGVNWYRNFDSPVWKGQAVTGGWWIGEGDLGRLRGGHAICVYGASDAKQAVKLVNSWGADYPNVWLPYETLDRLLRENGEACLVTDR